MKKIDSATISELLAGSTILGTGGGGRYDDALRKVRDLPGIELITIDEVPADSLVVTAYGAGGLTKPQVGQRALLRGLELLQQRLGKPIGAIVPVEIGPFSLAEAFWVATKLGVRVVDADLVGCRSVPEIFIELVTLARLSRCPLVFGNNEGDLVLLENASSPERLEQLIRSFADSSASNTFVFGYPYNKTQLARAAAKGSVSYCLEVAARLAQEFRLAGEGLVVADEKQEIDGFTRGRLEIAGNDRLTIEYKNEYLVLCRNGKVEVTCPDYIVVVNQDTGLGLNNGDDNREKRVAVYVRPAIAQWRTAAARRLFSPRTLGLPYNQRVLKG